MKKKERNHSNRLVYKYFVMFIIHESTCSTANLIEGEFALYSFWLNFPVLTDYLQVIYRLFTIFNLSMRHIERKQQPKKEKRKSLTSQCIPSYSRHSHLSLLWGITGENSYLELINMLMAHSF